MPVWLCYATSSRLCLPAIRSSVTLLGLMERKESIPGYHYDISMRSTYACLSIANVRIMSKQMTKSRERLLIRIPASLKTRLVKLAARERRSLNREIEHLLAQAVRSGTQSRSRVERQERRSINAIADRQSSV